MKRILPLCLCISLLLGIASCSRQRDYLLISPHEGQYVREENEGVIVVGSYDAMVSALIYLVTNSETKGQIRASNYSGTVTEDLANAVYNVAKRTPMGSYAVDYITYDCMQVVSYYEITVDISYSKTPEEISRIITTRGQNAVLTRLSQAMERYEPSLCLYVYSYEQTDLADYVRNYYETHPGTLQALPEIQTAFYPNEQSECILEIRMRYPEEQEEMLRRQQSVREEAESAAEYVHFRDNQTEQMQLLYLYLSERFEYDTHTTAMPVYSALCEGVASSTGFARAMQILCEELGIECHTVKGIYNGGDWSWNIVRLDGQYYHIDVMRDVISDSDVLNLNLDSEMSAYSWDTSDYPACAIRPDDWPDISTEPDLTDPARGMSIDVE